MISFKILLIDDEQTITNGLKTIIENSKIQFSSILTTSNSKESIDIILNEHPDIVVTDIRMPDVTGLDLIKMVNGMIQYKPVFIILSGYDDFKYAKKAIQCGVTEYLLKPVRKKEFIDLLNNIVKKLEKENSDHELNMKKHIRAKEGTIVLQEKYLNLIVQSTVLDESYILDNLFELGIRIGSDIFKVLTLDFKKNNDSSETLSGELQKFAVKNIIDNTIADFSKNCWTFFDSKSKLIGLFCEENESALDSIIKNISKTIQTNLMKYLNFEIYVGIGNSVKGIVNINRSYLQAIEASKYKINGTSKRIMFYSEIIGENDTFGMHTTFLARITNEIELFNRSNIIALVNEKFKYFKSKNISITKLEVFYNEFNRYVYDFFANKYKEYLYTFKQEDSKFEDICTFWSFEQLESHIKQSLLNLCDSIYISKNKNSNKKIIDQVMLYINNNCNTDISLGSISDQLSRSEGYLSTLFRKETGKNIIEYLTTVRIEKAKKLLAETNMKVYEISKNIGYTNPKHFFIVFKKFVGISPLQYRDKRT